MYLTTGREVCSSGTARALLIIKNGKIHSSFRAQNIWYYVACLWRLLFSVYFYLFFIIHVFVQRRGRGKRSAYYMTYVIRSRNKDWPSLSKAHTSADVKYAIINVRTVYFVCEGKIYCTQSVQSFSVWKTCKYVHCACTTTVHLSSYHNKKLSLKKIKIKITT